MGRETAKVMLLRARGTIIFTGATASVRGREGFAAFAGSELWFGKDRLREVEDEIVRLASA